MSDDEIITECLRLIAMSTDAEKVMRGITAKYCPDCGSEQGRSCWCEYSSPIEND